MDAPTRLPPNPTTNEATMPLPRFHPLPSWMRRSTFLPALLLGGAMAATIPYQGLATDAKGHPIPDTVVTADFALYRTQATDSALWRESQVLPAAKGLFSANLGDGTPLPDSLFDGAPLYLGVAIDGGTESSPRQILPIPPCAAHAGFADSAGTVGGLQDSLVSMRQAITTASDTVKRLLYRISSLEAFVATSSLAFSDGIAWNLQVPYGSLVDSRDGQFYRTVTIGTQTWMAQNLNYAGSSSDLGTCYGGSADSCTKYGRLYTWSVAMDGGTTSALVPSGIQGICPSGWHVPSDSEWSILEISIGMTASQAYGTGFRGSEQGNLLKSSSGWQDNFGTDLYGFRAAPGGYASAYAGKYGYWWSATQNSTTLAWRRGLYMDYGTIERSDASKGFSLSLRCVQD